MEIISVYSGIAKRLSNLFSFLKYCFGYLHLMQLCLKWNTKIIEGFTVWKRSSRLQDVLSVLKKFAISKGKPLRLSLCVWVSVSRLNMRIQPDKISIHISVFRPNAEKKGPEKTPYFDILIQIVVEVSPGKTRKQKFSDFDRNHRKTNKIDQKFGFLLAAIVQSEKIYWTERFTGDKSS